MYPTASKSQAKGLGASGRSLARAKWAALGLVACAALGARAQNPRAMQPTAMFQRYDLSDNT